MKKRALKRTSRKAGKQYRCFGTQELTLLAAVTILLLVLFAWQTNTLPGFLKP